MIYVFLVIVLLLAVGLLWLIGKNLGQKHGMSQTAKSTLASKWQAVEEMLAGDDTHAWTRAIMEADKLLDFALKEKNVAGTTLADRLKNSRALFRNIQPVWEAHKLRNQLVHEVHFELSRGQAERAVSQFKQALRELNAL